MSDQEARFAIELDVKGQKESESLADALARLKSQMQADMAGINELQAALKRLQVGGSTNTAVFKQLRDQLATKKASLASAQEAYVKLGGSFGNIKQAATESARGFAGTGASIRQLAAAAGETDGPLGNMIRAFGKLKMGGTVGVILAIVGTVLLLMTGVAAATVALTRFALVSADAARSQRLFLEAATGGRVAADALTTTLDNVAGRVAMAHGQLEELALSLARSGLEGRALDAALSAVATTSTVMGQAAGSALQSIAERARQTRRFVLGAFDLQGTGLKLADVTTALAKRFNVSFGAAQAALQNGTVRIEDGLEALDAAVQAKFGKIARAQLLAFSFQMQKAHENVSRLFAGVNIEPFLEALHDVLSVLEQSTITGRALRAMAETALNPLLAELAKLGPIAKAFFQGMVIGALFIIVAVLRLRQVFADAFGGIRTHIDWVKVAMYAGIAVVVALTGAAIALAAAFVIVAAALLIASIPFLLLVALIVGAVVGIGYLIAILSVGFAKVVGFLRGLDFAAIGQQLIAGLIDGITSGVGLVIDAVKGLGQSAMAALKSTLGIASPSKVFAEFGGYTAEGFAQGVEGGSGRVDDAVGAMVATPSQPTASSAGVGGQKAGGNTYQIINHFYGRSEDDDLVTKIRQVMTEVFTGAAIEMAAPLEPEAT